MAIQFNKPNFFRTGKILFLCVFLIFISLYPQPLNADKLDCLGQLVGVKDAVIVLNPKGDILFSKNAGQKLIPASILKILTSIAAIHYLGTDYQYKTEFYMDSQSNLKVKGYGDPLLISEVLSHISKMLSFKMKSINDIILDDSYFAQPLTIPGISESSEPYDAPNGALCANFNTVNFQRTKDGKYLSAEPQTPLLPFAIKRIKNSNIHQGRIVLTHKKQEATLYVGHLLAYFLKNEGVQCSGNIKTGTVDPSNDKPVYTYLSQYTLEQMISELLEYSNNFMANQLLITVGIHANGPPGSLEKGVRAVNAYGRFELKINSMDIIEGSGISRENKISAEDMMKIVMKFKPYSYLMRYENNEYYKTGTLKGIRTRAGYIENANNELYPFVILINTAGKSTVTITKQLKKSLSR